MAKVTMVGAINMALREEMERDERVIVLGEDVGKDGGVFRVTDGLFDKFGAERVVDTPLAEAAIAGTALGLAVNGMRPVGEFQFSGFAYQAFYQIQQHCARMRMRSRGVYNLPMVLRFPYGGGIRALEHHSESLEAIYVHAQGLKVVAPSNPYDAKGLLLSAIRDEDPVMYFEPKRLYRAFKQEVPEEDYTVPIGEAAVLKEGDDVTVVSWGSMIPLTKNAVADFEKASGKTCEVLDLRTVAPFDYPRVIKSVQKTGRCVIVHEGHKSCGLGAELIARINEQAFFSLQAPVQRVTGFDVPVPLPELEDHYYPNEQRVRHALEQVVAE